VGVLFSKIHVEFVVIAFFIDVYNRPRCISDLQLIDTFVII